MKKVAYILLLFAFSVGFAQQNESAEIPGLKIYPNPVTQGKVFIETDISTPKKIILFDVFGTPVLEKVLKTKELALPKIKPGIYVIKIFAEAKSSTRKLVIK
ncbi:MAG: T9SS type A sorting domain-containing protein [Cryomorphaceae bacterium]|nr:T9SS type A sorting domain-containing protein [Cryomorphaceae bacterium]